MAHAATDKRRALVKTRNWRTVRSRRRWAGSGAAAVAEIEKLAKLLAAVSRNPLNSQTTTRRTKTNSADCGWGRTPFDLATGGPLMMLLMEKISTPFLAHTHTRTHNRHSRIEMEIYWGDAARARWSQTMARNFAKFTFLN